MEDDEGTNEGRPKRQVQLDLESKLQNEKEVKERQKEETREEKRLRGERDQARQEIEQEVEAIFGSLRSDLSNVPTQLERVSSAVREAHSWLEAKRAERLDTERISRIKGASNMRYKELIPMDCAIGLLLYAHADWAEELAREILREQSDVSKVEIAERDGRMFWDFVVKAIADCPKSPEPTEIGSDSGIAQDMPDPSSQVSSLRGRHGGRTGQSDLAERLKRIHLGMDVFSGRMSQDFRPPAQMSSTWLPILKDKVSKGKMSASTFKASHILRYALGQSSPERSQAWSLLSRFTGQDMSQFRDQIQHTTNALLTDPAIDDLFDKFKIGLEPQVLPHELVALDWVEHSYECKVIRLAASQDVLPETITFINYYQGPNPELHKLPLPFLLNMHLHLGRVFNLKAMAEHLEDDYEDGEDEVEGLPSGNFLAGVAEKVGGWKRGQTNVAVH